jgi:hypothetical protein
MEEMYRTHKEPAWGWIGGLLASVSRADYPAARLETARSAPRRGAGKPAGDAGLIALL